jgi:hypothetical protein
MLPTVRMAPNLHVNKSRPPAVKCAVQAQVQLRPITNASSSTRSFVGECEVIRIWASSSDAVSPDSAHGLCVAVPKPRDAQLREDKIVLPTVSLPGDDCGAHEQLSSLRRRLKRLKTEQPCRKERVQRRRKLTKGPSEFREDRIDQPWDILSQLYLRPDYLYRSLRSEISSSAKRRHLPSRAGASARNATSPCAWRRTVCIRPSASKLYKHAFPYCLIPAGYISDWSSTS